MIGTMTRWRKPKWRVWIKELRQKLGLTQKDMPKLLEEQGARISLHSYQSWEVGRTTPTTHHWRALCKVLGITMLDVGKHELERRRFISEVNEKKTRDRKTDGIYFEL